MNAPSNTEAGQRLFQFFFDDLTTAHLRTAMASTPAIAPSAPSSVHPAIGSATPQTVSSVPSAPRKRRITARMSTQGYRSRRRLTFSDSDSDSDVTDPEADYIVDCNCFEGCPCPHCNGMPVHSNKLWCDKIPPAVTKLGDAKARNRVRELEIEVALLKDQLAVRDEVIRVIVNGLDDQFSAIRQLTTTLTK